MLRLPPQVALLPLLALTGAWAGQPRPAPPPAGPGERCLDCHTRYATQAVVHPPVREGLCFACHTSSSPTEHTFELRDEGRGLCAQCHSTRDTKKVLHPPVSEGLCLNCHDPHASAFPARLRQSTFDTCTTCHPAKAAQHLAAKTQHGALDERQNPKVCVACHDAHQSDHPKRLHDWPVEKVCLTCHDKVQTTPSGQALLNLKGWLDRHGELGMRHGPVREGRCPDCHEPHGTDNWRILKGGFPGTPYTPLFSEDTYGLCFRCHDARLLTEKTLTQKVARSDGGVELTPTALPQGERLVREGLTGFRNGDENLHFRHVNKQDKGRPCRLCHDVHASENPKHIRTSTPFGNWEFLLNFQKTATGGSCWPGCHAQRRYDREQRQENPK